MCMLDHTWVGINAHVACCNGVSSERERERERERESEGGREGGRYSQMPYT